MRVPRLAAPPLIDGRLAPGEWDGVAATSGFASQDLDWTLAPPWLQTTLWLGWDEGNLYLAMRARQDGAPTLARAIRDGDEAIAQDDALEWLLLPGADRGQARGPGGGFFRLVANARGAHLDQRWEGQRPELRPGWASQADLRCGRQDGDWVLEMRLPATALGRNPDAGQTWIMQAARLVGGVRLHTGQVPGGWLDWPRFPAVVLTSGEPAVQLLSTTLSSQSLEVELGLAAPPGDAAEAEVRLSGADGRPLRRTLAAPAGGNARLRLELPLADAQGPATPVNLEVAAAERILGRWNWRCRPVDDPEALDLRERWRRQRAACGLVGSLAELARIGHPLRRRLDQARAAGDGAAAERLARELAGALPWAPIGQQALAALAAAAERGDDGWAGIERDPDLALLLAHPRLAALRERMRASPGWLPRTVAGADRLRPRSFVHEGMLDWDPEAQQVVARWLPADGPPAATIVPAGDALAPLLNGWWDAGLAAGNVGDLYDNRDGGHSLLAEGLFPQVARTVYRLPLREADLSEGLPTGLRHQGPIVVVGNASQAEVAGAYRRSLGRRELLDPHGVERLLRQYAGNQIYVSPACFDHALASERGGLGDVMPALTPYGLASVGWSGTDQPLVRALFATLAAFPPAVKRRLLAEGRIAPALQMILRRCLSGIDSDDDYLTANAHPAAFAGGRLRLERMVAMAQALTTDALPPEVRVRVLEEDAPGIAGRDFFAPPGHRERLLDTPYAIARILRSVHRRQWRLVVGAEANGALGVQVRWALLRGRATVTASADGASAEIVIPWQERHPAAPDSPLLTDRIDVVCAAFDGRHWSAPAFISCSLPPDETRVYHPDGRIASVAPAATEPEGRYVDPELHLARPWRDEFDYAADGRLLGWTRLRSGGSERFDAEGRLLGPDGPRAVDYRSERRDGQRVPVVGYAPR